MSQIEYEHDWMVLAINDGSADYLLRLSQLIPDLNVVQLKRMEQEIDGRKVIVLGPRTDTVNAPYFMGSARELRLTIELK